MFHVPKNFKHLIVSDFCTNSDIVTSEVNFNLWNALLFRTILSCICPEWWLILITWCIDLFIEELPLLNRSQASPLPNIRLCWRSSIWHLLGLYSMLMYLNSSVSIACSFPLASANPKNILDMILPSFWNPKTLSWNTILTGSTRNKHQRMLRMARQSCCSSTVATPARSLISHGIPVKIGWLQALQKTTSSKFGRWQKTYTMTKMICLEMNLPELSCRICNLYFVKRLAG